MGFSNKANLPLPVALFLAADTYEHDSEVIGVTGFIKPIREIILTPRVTGKDVILAEQDVLDQFKSRLGSALHAYIEHVWKDDVARTNGLKALGYPQKTIDKIVVNPTKVKKGDIPIYTEKTGYKDVNGYMFRGTADVIFNGRLGDYKKTSTFSYADAAKNKKYALQGSLYRWMMPDLIKDDSMEIYEMYEDWVRFKATDPAFYPMDTIVTKTIPLMSVKETDKYVKNKIKMIEDLWDAPDDKIPECTDEDLWRKPPVFKYYKNLEKRERSSGNFTDINDAYAKKQADGNVGVVVEVKSTVKACKFCAARPVCGQAQRYAITGELET